MKIYVGNLEAAVSGSDLRAAFGVYGDVVSAKVSTDFSTGASRGFGFVEMTIRGQGEAAIHGLDGKGLRWRVMPVQEGRTSLRLRHKQILAQSLSGAKSSGGRPQVDAPAKPRLGKTKEQV
jgi:RNA recognition motif-containing protein